MKRIDNFNNLTFVYLLLIILFNILIHYFPFFRYSISSDDFSFLEKTNIGLGNFIIFYERPFQYIFVEFQNFLVGDNNEVGTIFNFSSNVLLALCVYFLFFNIIEDKKHSFFLSLIFSQFFAKAEIYHYPIFAHVNIANSIYIISIISILLFFKSKNYIFYLLSLIFFTTGIFWYEVGFFLPILYVIIAIINKYKNKSIVLFCLPFLFVTFFYLNFRLTAAFGLSPTEQIRGLNFNFLQSLTNIFNIIIGRSFIKHAYYGVYVFFNYFNLLYIFLLIIFNMIFLYFFNIFLKNFKIKLINKKLSLIFIVLFVISLIPNFLVGSAGGRNLILPSISISFFFLYLIYPKINKLIFLLLFFIVMIINQGNNLSQIISSKINSDMYVTLKENSNKIQQYKFVVFDIDSFKSNIEYSLIKNDNNNFNYFFGSQIFENWGLKSMVKRVTDQRFTNDDIYVSNKKFKKNGKTLNFEISKFDNKNNLIIEYIELSFDDVFIIDYNLVYENGFKFL